MSPDPTALTVLGAAGGAVIGLSSMAKGLLERALGPLADELGQQLLLGYRERNRNAATNRAAEMVAATRRAPQKVPLRTMLPLLEGASREDDPEMQERWAALLANATLGGDDDGMPPVFASILANLTPNAARGLELLAQPHDDRTTLLSPGRKRGGVSRQRFAKLLYPTEGAYVATEHELEAQANTIAGILIREALVAESAVIEHTGLTSREGREFRLGESDLQVTDLGLKFLRACTAPPVDPEEST